jgi:UDP:flavonoid glycosyltransferase YjiC (YdhE family)
MAAVLDQQRRRCVTGDGVPGGSRLCGTGDTAPERPAMRILFTTFAGTGHLHPLVPLAHALAAAGHTVAFAAAPAFCPAVEAVGFPCFPAGIDEPEAGWATLVPALRGVPRVGGAWTTLFMRHVFGDLLPQHIVPDLLTLGHTWRPDLIVRDPGEYGGCVAAECLGIPHATGREGPFRSPTHYRELFGESLDALRRTHGLPPDPDMAMLYRYLGFAWTPPRFLDSEAYVPPVMHFLRPMPFDQGGVEVLPGWVESLPARPTVYATLGTVFNKRPDLFAAIIAALGDEPVNLIVTVGRTMDPAQFGELPPNVHVEQYIPQTLLFPRCAAVVTHGGFGTVLSALSHGLPLVVIPIAADQPVNAQRCTALGVGRALDVSKVTPETVREAVRMVLNEPGYVVQAHRLREEMAALPEPDYAVTLLERLAQERQPMAAAIRN